MATLLQFPEKTPPKLTEDSRFQIVDGFFGISLNQAMAAIQYYAYVTKEQGKALDLLLALADLDELEMYVALSVNLLPLLTAVSDDTLQDVANGGYVWRHHQDGSE